jgi:hypothetical protein
MRGELGDFLADAGAVIGGATVLGAACGFIVGSIVHDFRPQTDPDEWARRGGLYCGVGGLVIVVFER